jgi:hypothetical protein
MNPKLQHADAVDLCALRTLVAGSPIRALPAPVPESGFSDWRNRCQAEGADALILAWIASHTAGVAPRRRLH